jgi:AraC family transcriptional regulator
MSRSGRAPAPGAYGRTLSAKFGVEEVPSIVIRSLQGAVMAVTEVAAAPLGRPSDPIPAEEAVLLSIVLRDLPDLRYSENGRMNPPRLIRAGEVMVHDLRRSPATLVDKPMHSVLLYLPRATLHSVADNANLPRVEDLHYEPGAGLVDEVVRGFGMALLPAVRAPEQANRIFLDYVTLAVAAHVAHTYGGMQRAPGPVRGGLAVWQERRAKELLAADLAGDTRLADVAQACGLSVSHFARAFRRSTGLAPHAWLQRRRVELAKDLLRRRDQRLSDIALACGFANQNHFTKVFSGQVGLSPGVWRRYLSE